MGLNSGFKGLIFNFAICCVSGGQTVIKNFDLGIVLELVYFANIFIRFI